MKLPHRRQFLHLAAGAAALPAASRMTWAQAYPSRPVRIIVPFAPGGTFDIMARLIGQWLTEKLGQPFVIENRPGAGGNIGTELVVRAPADGYTLLLVGAANAISATLYEKLNFNFIRDIVPVAGIARVPEVMVVNPSLPATTVRELIAYAKANPGKLTMASGGIGTLSHVEGELFKMMTGVNLVHVPYRGLGPALTDLLGGQVQVMFASMSASIEYVRAGKLRALAVTTATRSDELPDIPTVAEFVPGYEASGWFGMGAPKSTSTEVVDQLNKQINEGLADPNVKARLLDLGGRPMPMTPAELGKFAPPVRQYWPGALDRTAPSESRISKLSTSASGASASGRPGTRHANARRLEGDIVPSTTRAAPGHSPQVRPPSRSDTHGPISALADKAAATVRKGSAERKAQMVRMRISPLKCSAMRHGLHSGSKFIATPLMQ
jgi:tripartite-type tricarboxylate transporter receptor subunit TctC